MQKKCIKSFAVELSDRYKNPDINSILSDAENDSFDGLMVECKLIEIKVL